MTGVAVWVRERHDDLAAALRARGARPRLLVPTPNGTFVLGPAPVGEHTAADLRRVLGGGVVVEWTANGSGVRHADYLDLPPADPVALFREAQLFAEAEIADLLVRGGADDAVPAHPRPWWEPLLGEALNPPPRDYRQRQSPLMSVLELGLAALMPALVVWLAWLYLRPAPWVLALVGAVTLVVMVPLVVRSTVLRTRALLVHPVLDPLGLTASGGP